jgi:hypothetical protein
MKQLLDDWMFYLRMFFERFFFNVVMVTITMALGMGFVIMVMYIDLASFVEASQSRMTVLTVVVFSVAVVVSVIDMIMAIIEDSLAKKEEEKEKKTKEAAQCSEKLTSPLA